MTLDRGAPAEPAEAPPEPTPAGTEFGELRALLVGPEQRRLAELSHQVDAIGVTAEELADHLPEAIALRAGRDHQLARALGPTVEGALKESVRRNPREIATAIFPVLGPAIRKAIAETMAGLVRSINSAVEHSFSIQGLKWRVESWRSGVPYAEVVLKHALIYRVEQVFLIHAETGLLLAHVATPELKVPHADLISGMLTAIQDFTRDSFRPEEGGTLRTFSVGELTVLVEPGPQALIAAVIRGQAPDTVVRGLQDTLETIHLQWANPLLDFQGDPAPFEPATPLLAACLETVLSSDRKPAGSGRDWLRWAVPVGLVVGLLGVLAITARARWGAVVGRIRAEPGLLVVEADWGLRRSALSGLRDPFAARPNQLLAAAGIDTARVEGKWAPYLSLDSAIVTARARQLLGIPRGVAVALRGDTLALQGTGSISELSVAVAGAGLPPGIARLDLTGLALVLPPPADSLARAIETNRVLFPVGSAGLSGSAQAVIAAVALELRRILEIAATPGLRIEVRLTGRADPTGSEGVNHPLSQLRATAVASRLVALGVPAEVIRPDALGTSDPIAAPDNVRAQLNRSVSFALQLRPNHSFIPR